MRILAASFVLGLFAAACSSQHARSGAELKIDSGWFVGEGGTGDHNVPAVMWLGMCTSTAVSDNTLLFAGHCVGQGGTADGKMSNHICIQSGTMAKDACAETVWVPPSWNASENFHQDLAVAIFKRGTFKRYFEINEGSVKVGDKVFLVGYSQANLDRQDKGSKRWGFNTIAEFDDENVIVSRYGSSADNVAVSPGDSGGPLFKDCKVSGIASRMDEGGQKTSLHTNVTDKDNIAWFKTLRAQGAEFCGLADAKAGFCDTAARAEPRPAAGAAGGQPVFPCSETGNAGAGPTAPPKAEIFAGLDLTDGLHVSVPSDADKVFVCYDKAPAACTTEEIPVTLERTAGDRRILKTAAALTLGAASPRRMAVVAKDKNGRDLAVLAADLKAR